MASQSIIAASIASTCFGCGCCVRGGPGLAEMPSRQKGEETGVTVEIKWACMDNTREGSILFEATVNLGKAKPQCVSLVASDRSNDEAGSPFRSDVVREDRQAMTRLRGGSAMWKRLLMKVLYLYSRVNRGKPL